MPRKAKRKGEEITARTSKRPCLQSSPSPSPPLQTRSRTGSVEDISDGFDENAEDPGRIESQQILEAASILEKPTKYDQLLAKFRDEIERDKSKLEDRLKKEVKLAKQAEEQFKNAISKHLRDTIQSQGLQDWIHKNDKLSPYYNTDAAVHPYVAYNNLLKSKAQCLLDLYGETQRTATVDDTGPRRKLREWAENRQQMEKLLHLGKRVAERRLKKLLEMVLDKDVSNGENLESSTDADLVKDLFAGTSNGKGSSLIGKTLEYAERGVKKMLKSVPSEEDE